MRRLGFGDRWVFFIMECVTTITYSILVNEQAREVIKPSKGLRQWDPISSCLFILCVEGLVALIKSSEKSGETKIVAVTRGGRRKNYLLFADNCVIFGRVCILEWKKYQDLLNTYEMTLG